jgi:aspartate aminotransferase
MPIMESVRIQLSSRARALRPSSTLAVTAMVNAMKARGIDVIGFGAGQPDFDTPDHIKQAAIRALQAGQTKYTPTPGPVEAREAIARKLRAENSIDCAAEHIVITVGAKHAMFMTLQALVNPGDEAILPTPAWVSYAPMIELAGGRVVEVPAALENDFRITPDQLADAITPRTRVLILNSPSNPCGTMYSEDELRGLARVLEAHPDVSVITDEIYEKIIFGGIEHFSLASIPEMAERVITINGLSKAFAMTGWRIGYLCAPGNGGALAKAVTKLQDQMTSNITSFCFAAIVEALANGGESVEGMRRHFARRAELMHGLVSRMPGLRSPRPTGAFYLFPDVAAHVGKTTKAGRTITSAQSFAEALLEEARVAVVPGEDFGECARSHVRLSFACSDEHIREGCARMDDWLRGLR